MINMMNVVKSLTPDCSGEANAAVIILHTDDCCRCAIVGIDEKKMGARAVTLAMTMKDILDHDLSNALKLGELFAAASGKKTVERAAEKAISYRKDDELALEKMIEDYKQVEAEADKARESKGPSAERSVMEMLGEALINAMFNCGKEGASDASDD